MAIENLVTTLVTLDHVVEKRKNRQWDLFGKIKLLINA
jgi:hypothetical protein